MTAETDAMRLVPVEPTVEMIDAYFNTVQRFGFHACINASTAWSAMLAAAAPAVQPAAGRTLGQVAYEGWAQGLPGCEWSNQTATQKRAWEKAAQAVAALSRPGPASEGDGE